MNQKGVWIKGSFFNAKNYFDSTGNCQKIIKSSVYKTEDNVAQGYKPKGEGNGILYSWKNKPLAYWDIPTLNNMVFSKRLWESIHENAFIKAALDNHCFWGEDQHRDDSEIHLKDVAIRVNDFHCDENNMVWGDIDLMDTGPGLAIYSLAKTGAIGNSSRGFGDLDDIGNGLTKVNEDTYLAVSWDCVGFPACPPCMSMYTIDNPPDLTQSVMDLEKGLREQISSAIEEAYAKNPANEWIAAMFNSLHLGDKSVTMPLASSANRYPSVKAVKSSMKKFPSNKEVKKLFK